MNDTFFMAVIVPLSILLPIFLGLIKFKQLAPGARILFWYLVVAGLTNFTVTIIAKYLHKNNLPLIHIFTVAEVIFFTLYYRYLSGSRNRIFIFIPVLFTILSVINTIFFQSIFTYNSYTRSAEAIICIFFALNYFAGLAAASSNKKTANQPDFYFNTGIFLYFSGAFMLFVFSNFIITNLSKTNFFIIWNIHAALLLLMYLLFSMAFLLCKK